MYVTREAIPYPGRFYVRLGGKHVEIRPSKENNRLIWNLVDAVAIGGLGGVREESIRWTSGDILPDEVI